VLDFVKVGWAKTGKIGICCRTRGGSGQEKSPCDESHGLGAGVKVNFSGTTNWFRACFTLLKVKSYLGQSWLLEHISINIKTLQRILQTQSLSILLGGLLDGR